MNRMIAILGLKITINSGISDNDEQSLVDGFLIRQLRDQNCGSHSWDGHHSIFQPGRWTRGVPLIGEAQADAPQEQNSDMEDVEEWPEEAGKRCHRGTVESLGRVGGMWTAGRSWRSVLNISKLSTWVGKPIVLGLSGGSVTRSEHNPTNETAFMHCFDLLCSPTLYLYKWTCILIIHTWF